MEWHHGGSLVKIVKSRGAVKRQVGGKRGEVKGFTRGSQRRMLDAINAVDETRVCGAFWGTLTSRPMDHAKFKRCIGAWYRRLEREWSGRWSLLWRFEAHESGALHFHFLMVWMDREPQLVASFRPWNDRAWSEVCGADNVGEGACRVTLERRWRGAAYYCGKYAAKMGEGTTGRVWGIKRREFWPVSKSSERVPMPVAVKFIRALQRLTVRRAARVLVSSTAWVPRPDAGSDAVAGGPRPIWKQARGDRSLESLASMWFAGGAGRAALRSLGWSVKLWRPRVRFRSQTKVWAAVTETDTYGRERRYLQHVDDEQSFRDRGTYAVGAEVASRLLEWAWTEYIRGLEFGPP